MTKEILYNKQQI